MGKIQSFSILLLFYFSVSSAGYIYAQNNDHQRIDSLVSELSKAGKDTSKVNIYMDLSKALSFVNPNLGNGQMVLSITDNGPGADAEKFRALYDEGHVVGIKTGLGMHLIRDLAKAIHCKIEIHSLKESGTEIKLTF